MAGYIALGILFMLGLMVIGVVLIYIASEGEHE